MTDKDFREDALMRLNTRIMTAKDLLREYDREFVDLSTQGFTDLVAHELAIHSVNTQTRRFGGDAV